MNTNFPKYLRVTIARWDIKLNSRQAIDLINRIETRGLEVFRAQPGFIRYRHMRADETTTIAVAEWESEELGRTGAEQYREWMRKDGIMEHITLETYSGDILVAS